MTNSVDELPSPPRIPPKLRLHPSELLGIPLIAALPLLALLGVFGPEQQAVQRRSGDIEWSVEYPSRIRYAKIERITVHLENRGETPVSEIRLGFDPGYIHAFADVVFDPEATSPYLVNIPELGPGESRLVAVQLTAEEYGPRQGWVSVSAGGNSATAELSTFVFP